LFTISFRIVWTFVSHRSDNQLKNEAAPHLWPTVKPPNISSIVNQHRSRKYFTGRERSRKKRQSIITSKRWWRHGAKIQTPTFQWRPRGRFASRRGNLSPLINVFRLNILLESDSDEDADKIPPLVLQYLQCDASDCGATGCSWNRSLCCGGLITC
jgi:hypothetical protein